MSVGASLQSQYSHKITNFGSDLVLPNGSAVKAIEVKDERRAAKYLRIDDLNAPEKLQIVLELPGSLFPGKIVAPGMTVTWETISYLIEGPLHPDYMQNVCTRLFIVLSKN
jgi:hypothetical protein